MMAPLSDLRSWLNRATPKMLRFFDQMGRLVGALIAAIAEALEGQHRKAGA